MQRKLMVLFTVFVLISLLTTPGGTARAQSNPEEKTPRCPAFDRAYLKDHTLLQSLSAECVKVYKELIKKEESPVNEKPAAPEAVIGPDGFGYTLNDAFAYYWVPAGINSGVVGDDEASGPMNIGFNFPFYGMTQTQLYFSTNGLITFGQPSYDWGGTPIPNGAYPNNFIAPLWDDFTVGDGYNSGAIYYSSGGVAPNRYYVVEWRDVELWGGSLPFTFETILYENGDIVFQYKSTPGYCGNCTRGIEDSLGYQGLPYYSYFINQTAVRFLYPAPAARLLVSPLEEGQFARIGGQAEFTITITNTGGLGTDTYDLATVSPWPGTLYFSNGVNPLIDTDGDSVVDTGPVLQGKSAVVIARFDAPMGAQTGSSAIASITATSSLNPSKTQTVQRTMTIPAAFANVFQDWTNGNMSFLTAHPTGTHSDEITSDNPEGYHLAVTRSPGGDYFYAWSNYYYNGYTSVSDIEYAILDHNGGVSVPAAKLTNNSSALNYTRDNDVSVAIAPNGTIAAVWTHYIYDYSTDTYNHNIYIATMTASGSLLTGPTNLTNNWIWATNDTLNVPNYFDLTIASTDDNRFVVAWREEREPASSAWTDDIWYAVLFNNGGFAVPPTPLTADGMSRTPSLTSLAGGKVFITWSSFSSDHGPYYAVLNSSGAIVKTQTALGDGTYDWSSDSVLLPSGKIAVASVSASGVQLLILNSSYAVVGGPTVALNYASPGWDYISVTTDSANHVIMTWASDNNLFYALADSNGNFITQPISYRSSPGGLDVSVNGQGNAPFSIYTFRDVPDTHWAWSYIEQVYASGITGGCTLSPLNYCPGNTVTRAQMAIFLLRAEHGSDYTPPAATGMFSDVPITSPTAPWIEQLAREKITGGCSATQYCPTNPVTRAQMAIFLLRAEHGFDYTPPPATGAFLDVPKTDFTAPFIEQLANEQITGGCGGGNYCPGKAVTRDQMAIFLVRAFKLAP